MKMIQQYLQTVSLLMLLNRITVNRRVTLTNLKACLDWKEIDMTIQPPKKPKDEERNKVEVTPAISVDVQNQRLVAYLQQQISDDHVLVKESRFVMQPRNTGGDRMKCKMKVYSSQAIIGSLHESNVVDFVCNTSLRDARETLLLDESNGACFAQIYSWENPVPTMYQGPNMFQVGWLVRIDLYGPTQKYDSLIVAKLRFSEMLE